MNLLNLPPFGLDFVLNIRLIGINFIYLENLPIERIRYIATLDFQRLLYRVLDLFGIAFHLLVDFVHLLFFFDQEAFAQLIFLVSYDVLHKLILFQLNLIILALKNLKLVIYGLDFTNLA